MGTTGGIPLIYFLRLLIFCISLVDSSAFFLQVDLLRGQKSDKVDVTLQPEELEAMENVLPAK